MAPQAIVPTARQRDLGISSDSLLPKRIRFSVLAVDLIARARCLGEGHDLLALFPSWNRPGADAGSVCFPKPLLLMGPSPVDTRLSLDGFNKDRCLMVVASEV